MTFAVQGNLVTPSIRLKSHWVLVVMDQFTHRLIGFGVHADDIDGIALCRMFNRIISGKKLPCYLSSDHDPLFEYHRWQANLRILEIEPIKSIPYTPIPYPYVERLIGGPFVVSFLTSGEKA